MQHSVVEEVLPGRFLSAVLPVARCVLCPSQAGVHPTRRKKVQLWSLARGNGWRALFFAFFS